EYIGPIATAYCAVRPLGGIRRAIPPYGLPHDSLQQSPTSCWEFVILCGEADRDESSGLILRSIAVAARRSQCVSKDGGGFSTRGHPSRRSHASHATSSG